MKKIWKNGHFCCFYLFIQFVFFICFHSYYYYMVLAICYYYYLYVIISVFIKFKVKKKKKKKKRKMPQHESCGLAQLAKGDWDGSWECKYGEKDLKFQGQKLDIKRKGKTAARGDGQRRLPGERVREVSKRNERKNQREATES